jgi:glycosyltransferase involved in cell wall biosynthesis
VHATPLTLLRSLGLGAAALLGLVWWRGLSPATGAMGALLLFALAAVVRRARDPRPLIVIDDTGIADLRLKIGTLAWKDIRRAYACSLKGATFICFEFHEPEGYLRRVLEAMASARPVVASAVGGVPELLGQGTGEPYRGRLVPPGDPQAIAGALRDWQDEDAQRAAGQAARAFVVGQRSLERMVADDAELYAPAAPVFQAAAGADAP